MTLPPQVFSGTNDNRLGLALQYIYDTGTNSYRAVKSSDLASNISISGGSFSMASTVGVTGGYIGISGGSVNVQITGNPNFNLSSNVPSGRIVAPTNMVSGATGSLTGFQVSPVGALYTIIPNLDRNNDQVTAFVPSSATVSGQQGVRTGIGTVLNANFRNLLYLSNVGTQPILVALSGTCNSGNFSMILGGGTSNFDGRGSSWSTDAWLGSVSVSGSGILYTCFEF